MLAIIPARGGSKGLPGKNIKLLNGKPLIAYTIQSALAAEGVSRVIVSTDCEDIAAISSVFGAECPFMRPPELAEDSSRAIDAFKFTLNELEKKEKSSISEFMVLQPTSPFRTAQDIDNAVRLFREKDAESVISYCQASRPLRWHKLITEEGKFLNIFEDKINNRQEEEIAYYPNGAIYIFKRALIDAELYYTERSFAYIMEKNKSLDIDTAEDFEFAEFLMEKALSSPNKQGDS